MKYLVDSDVLIDFLRGNPKALNYLRQIMSDECFISVISIAELLVGIRDKNEEVTLRNFISLFRFVYIDESIAKNAGELLRKYGNSHHLRMADAMIAASAIHIEAQLVTLNKKHFPMMKLEMPYKK